MNMDSLPEPWMRGPMKGVSPFVAPVLYSFQQAREDLAEHTEGLTPGELWLRPFGFGPVGFHIRHAGGSVERLTAYLEGKQLAPEQLAAQQQEMAPGANREELLAELEAALARAERVILRVDASQLTATRTVGRKRLPTTVIGLLIHIAEHTQRHVGQAIAAAKLARAMR